jgi:peroxiredoxin
MKKYIFLIFLAYNFNAQLYSQVSIGDPAINFTLPNLSNQPVSLQQFAGDIILLNFFATWCPPCQIEAPQLEDSIWQAYMNQGVTVLGVDLQESAGAVFQFRQQYNLTYPMVLDVNGAVFSAYGFTIIPSNVLIGRDGRIVWIEEGFDIPRFVNLIDSLVQLTDINLSPQSTAKPETFKLLGTYPNPFNNATNIRLNILKSGNLQIDLFDITGRSLFSDSYRVSPGEIRVPLKFSDFASGTYIYMLTMGNRQVSGRLIYQK